MTLGDSSGTVSHSHRIRDYVPLAELVKDFIGPDFRLVGGMFPPLFVSKKVYGDQEDSNVEVALRGRYQDFQRLTYYRGGKVTLPLSQKCSAQCTFYKC